MEIPITEIRKMLRGELNSVFPIHGGELLVSFKLRPCFTNSMDPYISSEEEEERAFAQRVKDQEALVKKMKEKGKGPETTEELPKPLKRKSVAFKKKKAGDADIVDLNTWTVAEGDKKIADLMKLSSQQIKIGQDFSKSVITKTLRVLG